MADKQSAKRQQSGERVYPSAPRTIVGRTVQFAECDESQSGQRFLDGSAPRLKRHVAYCETAAGDSYSPTAGKDEKPSQEFEGSALIGGEAAVPLSSLDTIQNNRDTLRRDPYHLSLSKCGRLTLRGVARISPTSAKFTMVRCKCWTCPTCAQRKANRYRKAIGELAEAHRLNKLLTLTLSPEKLNGEDSTRFINRIFVNLRIYLKRKLGRSPKYIRILEYQKNGNAHLHILLGDYVPQQWLSEAWSSLGGGHIVDIRRVTMHRVSHYLSKYLTKQMILSAPKRARRVTTSRGIKLNPKVVSELSWSKVSLPIGVLYQFHWKEASNIQTDAEGNVTGFDLTFPNRIEKP